MIILEDLPRKLLASILKHLPLSTLASSPLVSAQFKRAVRDIEEIITEKKKLTINKMPIYETFVSILNKLNLVSPAEKQEVLKRIYYALAEGDTDYPNLDELFAIFKTVFSLDNKIDISNFQKEYKKLLEEGGGSLLYCP